jgi:hypothetical protein
LKIISHRGFWCKKNEPNTLGSFAKAFEFGFGVETDFRDYLGEIVISHDVPKGNLVTGHMFFELYKKIGSNLPLAINIKSDGLQELIVNQLKNVEDNNFFVFDMSIPDSLAWTKYKVPLYARQSEIEINPILYEESSGIWLDCFKSDWWKPELIDSHLENGKNVCIVSPELHKRDPQNVWKILKKRYKNNQNVLICTDYPSDFLDLISNA